MTLTGIITSKISRLTIAAASLLTAATLAFGGLSPVGAQAVGTYDCGTYGGGTYNSTDCTDSTTTTTPTPTPKTSQSNGNSTNTANGSSTTSTDTSTTGTTILLNDYSEYTASTGKELPLKKGDIIYFNLGGEKHTVTVKSFDANTLIVTIASMPTDVSVPFNQTVNYDVDKDGTPDIALTYSKLASDSASVNAVFRSLAKATTTTTPVTTGSSTDTSTGGTTTTTSSMNLGWLWIIPVIVGVGLLVGAIIAIRKRKAAAAGGNNTFGQF